MDARGGHSDQLDVLAQSRWDTQLSPPYCHSGDSSNQNDPLQRIGDQRVERVGRNLSQCRTEGVSGEEGDGGDGKWRWREQERWPRLFL